MSTHTLAHPAPPAVLSRSMSLGRREPWIVFGVSFLLYALIGWVMTYVLQTYSWDGITRIAQAYGVLFSRDPHLAAIGFVWPPIPAFIEIPLVFLLKPLGLVLLAGPLMSAFFAALALALLCGILRRFELGQPWRSIWVAAFGSHQLIVHNGALGLSEAPFLAFLLLSLSGFVAWEQSGRTGGLIWAGVGAALAAGCRYEGLAWVAVMMVAIAWQVCVRSGGYWGGTAVGSMLAFAIPALWALTVWILLNWQIVHNPIYFLVGPGATATGPDTARAVGPTHPFAFAYGSLGGSLALIWRQALDLAPALLLATALLVVYVVWQRRWSDLAYLAIGWSILGFTFAIALRGILPPWLRYFFWLVPAGVIVGGAACRAVTGWKRQLTAAALAVVLLVPTVRLSAQAWQNLSGPVLLRGISATVLSPETVGMEGATGELDDFHSIANYLNAQGPGRLTLLDASIAFALVFFLDRPQNLVLTTDRDFFAVLGSPVGQVDQVLVPYPTLNARGRSEVLKQYPDLYEGSEPWAVFLSEFTGPRVWRLYGVVARE